MMEFINLLLKMLVKILKLLNFIFDLITQEVSQVIDSNYFDAGCDEDIREINRKNGFKKWLKFYSFLLISSI